MDSNNIDDKSTQATDTSGNADDAGDMGDTNSTATASANPHEDCETKLKETENNWKRALADYKNLEKRMNEDRYLMAAFANASLLARILPILDNLEMVDAHSNDMGLKLTIKEFKQILNDEGMVEINPINKDFDTITMEAVDTVDGEESNKNKVIEVLIKGYKLKDKLIRPARVKVGK